MKIPFRCAALALSLNMSLAGAAGDDPYAYVDLTADFARFVDETAGADEAAHAAMFRRQFGALLPGFYAPQGADPARYDARVARALAEFPALRPKYEQVQREFPAAFKEGIRHFREIFPGFEPGIDVYLLHSLGEMDGGTRELGGKHVLIFGADVIAQIHETRELTPFLDHELFHVLNMRSFPGCDEVWCVLWTEGLATYAAKVMNPGADDAQLLLTFPKPIRAAVDASWPEAACDVRAKLDSGREDDLRALFQGGTEGQGLPRRFGYYVGLRAMEELGGKYRLAALAGMPMKDAKPLLMKSLDRLIRKAGGCRD